MFNYSLFILNFLHAQSSYTLILYSDLSTDIHINQVYTTNQTQTQALCVHLSSE